MQCRPSSADPTLRIGIPVRWCLRSAFLVVERVPPFRLGYGPFGRGPPDHRESRPLWCDRRGRRVTAGRIRELRKRLSGRADEIGPSAHGCSSTRVTRIGMELTDGEAEFLDCLDCEHRSWEHSGEVVDVDVVLTETPRAR